MKVKKFIVSMCVVAMTTMIMGMVSAVFAEPNGPIVEEYMEYVDDSKRIEPGSLSGDVNLSTVGKGLYYDGQDFYFFVDTGVMASNYMFNIEGDRFFFGEDGKMVKNELVNYNGEIYFFDVNGAMYKNRWYTQEEIDTFDNTITYSDYYFGPTGRAYRADDSSNCNIIVKTIDGERYGFDTEGVKVEGYYDEQGEKRDPDEDPAFANCLYYFDPDENGAATTGWHYYEGATRMDEYDSDEEIVLYFDEKTCRKVAAKANSDAPDRCVSRTIEGQRYMFDSNGVRRNKWYKTEDKRGGNSNVRYFSEDYDGYLSKGWFLAVPGVENNKYDESNNFGLQLKVNVKKHKDDEPCWFYAGSNGNILRKTIRKIGNYVYAFDEDGVMQQDAMVRTKDGEFIKAYQTENLYKANVLYDPYDNPSGIADFADNDPAGNRGGIEDPANIIDKEKGLLNVRNGEQWMYFAGDMSGEDKVGSRCKVNVPYRIELNDEDIDFICNTTGGYTYKNATTQLTDIVNRNKKMIQNGVLLRPNADDNNYGLVRRFTEKQRYETNSIQNWQGKILNPYTDIDLETGTGTENPVFEYKYVLVKGSGDEVTSQYSCFKDKNGNYIYTGIYGDLIGVYPYEGTCHLSPATEDLPKGATGEDVIIKAGTAHYWTYKDTDKKTQYGLPPESERIDSKYLWLNINPNGMIDGGPYENGIAKYIYKDSIDE